MSDAGLLGMLGLSPCACCGGGAGASEGAAGTTASFRARYRGANDGGRVSVARDLTVDLSQYALGPDAVKRALNDFAGIRDILAANPDGALAMAEAVQRGDIDRATQIAGEIGLTEEELLKRGGGLGFLVVFAAAVVLVLVTATPTSVEADPAPKPSYPLTVEEETKADVDSYLGE